jgi:hypothetical protein
VLGPREATKRAIKSGKDWPTADTNEELTEISKAVSNYMVNYDYENPLMKLREFIEGGLDKIPLTPWLNKTQFKLGELDEPSTAKFVSDEEALSGAKKVRGADKDTANRFAAVMAQLWGSLNPETGKVEAKFPRGRIPDEAYISGSMDYEDWKAINDELDAEPGFHPGIIDDIAALPGLGAMGLNYLGADVESPEFSKRAFNRIRMARRDVRDSMMLKEPETLQEYGSEAFAYMAGQPPLLGSTGLTRGLSKVPTPAKVLTEPVRAALEFTVPVVRPTAKTYAAGTAAGTALLAGADYKTSNIPDNYEMTLEVLKDMKKKERKEIEYAMRQKLFEMGMLLE